MRQRNLVSHPDHVELFRTTVLSTGPWRESAVDLLGPLPTGKSILVVIEYYSRYCEIEVMKSRITSKHIERLETRSTRKCNIRQCSSIYFLRY